VFASLRYDTSTHDLYPEDPTRGTYESPGWLKFQVSGLRFEKNTPVQIDVLDGFNDSDGFQVLANGQSTVWPTPLPPFAYTELFMSYWQTRPPLTMMSSDALPTAVDFSPADQSLCFARVPSATDYYEIQFQLTQVPEPGTWALLALLLCGLCGRTHFRAQRL